MIKKGKKMLKENLKLIVAFLALFFGAVQYGTLLQAQSSRQFSGDLVIKTANSEIRAKIYINGSHIHRLEMPTEEGKAIFIRPKEARGKIWMLNPEKKQYRILEGLDTHEDPLQAWTDLQYDMSGEAVGEEVVNGHNCVVYDFKYPNKEQVSLKVWLADDLDYVIKREANSEAIKGTFVISNIKKEPIDESLFVIPPDFTELKLK
jgi:hypothetical protein